MANRRRYGFTLIEMLVVIVIIGVLAAILLPALHSMRERGRKLTCQNNLRNLGQTIRSYCTMYTYFPPVGYTPLYEEKDYPMEVIAIFMGWMDKPLKDGGLPPKVILCPSCDILRHPKWNGAPPWNSAMRHYAANGHCDTTTETFLMEVSYTCVGNGKDPSPWPHISGGTANFQVRKMDQVTHLSKVAIYADSNDECFGSGANHIFDWKMSSDRNYRNGRYPTRHGDGGNFVFLDGHTEFLSKDYISVPANQDDWLLGSSLSDGRVWSEP